MEFGYASPCSKLIDSDINRYTKEKLEKWKSISEDLAILDLESHNTVAN